MAAKRKFNETEAPSSSPPTCSCGFDSVQRVCQKPGPNNGRPFFTCRTSSCSFFRSIDGKPWNKPTGPTTSTNSGDNETTGDESPEKKKRNNGCANGYDMNPAPFLDNIVKGSSRVIEMLSRQELVSSQSKEVLAKMEEMVNKMESMVHVMEDFKKKMN